MVYVITKIELSLNVKNNLHSKISISNWFWHLLSFITIHTSLFTLIIIYIPSCHYHHSHFIMRHYHQISSCHYHDSHITNWYYHHSPFVILSLSPFTFHHMPLLPNTLYHWTFTYHPFKLTLSPFTYQFT